MLKIFLNTSGISKLMKYNIFFSKSKLNLSIFVLLFFFITFYKSSTGNFLNGLPIINKFETLIVLFILPYIFFFNLSIFNNLFTKILIILLLILKLYLINFPYSGVLHKQFFFDNELKDYVFKESYNSFWNNEITTIQEDKWEKREHFPLDWLNFNYNLNNKLGLTVTKNSELNFISVKHQIEFDLFIHEKSLFGIKAEGVEASDLVLIDDKDIINNIKVNDSFDINSLTILNKGKYKIKGYINYRGNAWSLIPYIYVDEILIDPFKENLILHEVNEDFNLNDHFKLNLFSNIFKIIFILLISFCIIGKKFEFITQNIKFIILSTLLIILYLSLNYFLNIFFNYVNLNIFKDFFSLSLSLLVFSVLLLIFNKKNINFLKLKKIIHFFYIITPVIILHWHLAYIGDFFSTSFYTLGDDWIQFQKYSRDIVLNGEWLVAGEKVFYFRPALRYFFAIYHIFFGESGYSFKIIEVWLIILSVFFLVKILELNKFKISDQIVFCSIIFIIFFGEKYATLIGRGISEFYGLFFLSLSMFIILVLQIEIKLKIIIVSIIGIISAWIREEKILMSLSLIFLFYDNMKINYKSNIYFTIYNIIRNKFLYLLVFTVITLIGFPFLFELRNYYTGGNFTFATHPSVLVLNLISFYKMLFAVEWPNIPRVPGLIIFVSCLVVLLSCTFNQIFRLNDNIGYIIIILSILLPSLILEMPGYSPRHTIYLLPISLLYLFIIKNKIKLSYE